MTQLTLDSLQNWPNNTKQIWPSQEDINSTEQNGRRLPLVALDVPGLTSSGQELLLPPALASSHSERPWWGTTWDNIFFVLIHGKVILVAMLTEHFWIFLVLYLVECVLALYSQKARSTRAISVLRDAFWSDRCFSECLWDWKHPNQLHWGYSKQTFCCTRNHGFGSEWPGAACPCPRAVVAMGGGEVAQKLISHFGKVFTDSFQLAQSFLVDFILSQSYSILYTCIIMYIQIRVENKPCNHNGKPWIPWMHVGPRTWSLFKQCVQPRRQVTRANAHTNVSQVQQLPTASWLQKWNVPRFGVQKMDIDTNGM